MQIFGFLRLHPTARAWTLSARRFIHSGARAYVPSQGRVPLFAFILLACMSGKVNAIEIQGQLAEGDPTQTGRLNRFSPASTCAFPKAPPDLYANSGNRKYQQHTLTNNTGSSTCVTVRQYSGTCGNRIFSVVYSDSFDPANINSNYLADAGSGPQVNQAVAFSFTLANAATAQVIVHELGVGMVDSCSYSLEHDLGAPKLSGLSVAPVAVTSATLKATSDRAGTAFWVVYHPGNTVFEMPTAAEVKAGSNHGSLEMVAYGSTTMAANAPSMFHLTGLVADTEYEVYLMVEDASGIRSLVSDRQVFTTKTGFEGKIGGTVSGLIGGGLTLLLNAGTPDELTLPIQNNGGFTFGQALAQGASYGVTVQTQPTEQICTVTSGSGTMDASPVGNVAVDCTTKTYSVGGTITGLKSGSQITLQNNGADNLVLSANNAFTFSQTLPLGVAYAVSILEQPTGQSCTVQQGAGTMGTGNVSTVVIKCLDDLVITTTSFGNLQVGQEVDHLQLMATGGIAPYTWSAVSSSQPLPAGLSLEPTGVLSGIPTASGSYSTLVTVTDSSGAISQQRAVFATKAGSGSVTLVIAGEVAAAATVTAVPTLNGVAMGLLSLMAVALGATRLRRSKARGI